MTDKVTVANNMGQADESEDRHDCVRGLHQAFMDAEEREAYAAGVENAKENAKENDSKK